MLASNADRSGRAWDLGHDDFDRMVYAAPHTPDATERPRIAPGFRASGTAAACPTGAGSA